MTKKRLSGCICLSADDRRELIILLNKAIDSDIKEIEQEKKLKRPKLFVEVYEKDLIVHKELRARIDEIPDCET